MTRTRVSLSLSALVAGLALSACGAAGAPTDASAEEFCAAYESLFEDLDASDLENMPDEQEMVDSIHGWAEEMEKVGTPEDMPDDAREGFELQVEQAADLDAEDLKADSDTLDELDTKEQELSKAFNEYAAKTCGDTELPEVPEMPGTPSPSED